MDLIKLLPILFVVAQGEGRPLEQQPQVLPSIPGYVPVYIQQGPAVEVIYETGRRVAVQDSKKEEAADQSKEPEKTEEAAQTQQEVEEKEPADQKKEEVPVEPSPPASPSEEQQNVISESGAPAEEESPKKEDSERGSRGIGTVLEIGSYQSKERK